MGFLKPANATTTSTNSDTSTSPTRRTATALAANTRTDDPLLARLVDKITDRDAKLVERLAEKANHGKKDREDRTDKTCGKANSETHGKVDAVRGKGRSGGGGNSGCYCKK